ncbi:aldehyde dehydrogenase [Candidatus Dependentiae bacterium]|nr:aldehyde dehydrogenase [Candidatus Dependentiae bacterium]
MNFEKIIVINPGDNYKIIAEIEASTSQEIDQKIMLAHQVFKIWSQYSVHERIKILEKLFKAFDIQRHEIAKLIAIEMGMPISVCSEIDIRVGLNYFQGYLDNAEVWLKQEIVFENATERHTVFFEGLGVVAASIPWNFPFTNFIWAVIPNLLVGNTIVLKHSENCVLTTKLLEKIFLASHILEGVCNFVYGKGHDVGDYLINSNVDMIWFTGSTQTGHHVYQVAASKAIPVILELGGSAPGIIFEDVDIDKVIDLIYVYRFANSGQSCDALKRLIVHESIFDKIVDKLQWLLSTKKVGSPLDITTDLGPIVNKKQLETIQAQVADAIYKGGKIICGGKQPEDLMGSYYEPTIITNISKSMKIYTEEVFGPVLAVLSFKTQQEAIDLANDTIFGLGGYIFSSDKKRAFSVAQKLKTGNIGINKANYVIPQDVFGGYKKSGIGREHGKIGIRSLCQMKLIAEEK